MAIEMVNKKKGTIVEKKSSGDLPGAPTLVKIVDVRKIGKISNVFLEKVVKYCVY